MMTPPAPTDVITKHGRVNVFRHGSGPPVVVLHAAGGAGAWNDYFGLLAEHREVFAPDHLGFGLSDDLGEIDTMTAMADHYLDLLDVLGLEQVDLVGASLGGWLAAEIASIAPQRVRRLVLIAPAGLHVEGDPPADLFNMEPPDIVRSLYLDQRLADKALSVPLDDAQAEMAARDAQSFARLAQEPFVQNPELAGRLDAITAPTLVIAAEVDRVVPRSHSERYAELIDGAQLAVIPGCGHALYFERPAAVADVVLDFID